MPITLDVSDIEVNRYNIIPGSRITLRDFRDEQPLAILTGIAHLILNYLITVEDVWRPDKFNEAQKVFGTSDFDHPAVNYLHMKAKDFYVGGKVQAINRLNHYDYIENRCTSMAQLS